MLYMIAGALLVGLICVDMGIKQYIEDTFGQNEERETIIDRMVLRKVYNKGFLLNTLDKRPEIVKGCSASVGIGIIIYDIWLFLRKGRWLQKLGMIFLTAGAFSNVYDRLARGKVIDYVGIQWKNSRLAKITANLADVYIVIGAMICTVANLFKR